MEKRSMSQTANSETFAKQRAAIEKLMTGLVYYCSNCFFTKEVLCHRIHEEWMCSKNSFPVQVYDLQGRDEEVTRMMTPVLKMVNVHVHKELERPYGDNLKSFRIHCSHCGDVVGAVITDTKAGKGCTGTEYFQMLLDGSTVCK